VPVWQGTRGERSLEKWRLTAREAAKQSRRAWIPEVPGLAATADVVRLVAAAACAIVLEPGADASLSRLSLPGSGDLLVVVGPEGGITPEENAAFLAAGATGCRLGPTVLRTSTAGPVAAAILLTRSGRWS
jgi:16S rRNA (uracil1498-N3)-methyltransferase